MNVWKSNIIIICYAHITQKYSHYPHLHHTPIAQLIKVILGLFNYDLIIRYYEKGIS